jgi:AraC-like DNA-binding protein
VAGRERFFRIAARHACVMGDDGGVDDYREHPAPAGMACLWTRTASADKTQRIVPDGCTDVIWSEADGSLFVAGPDTGPHVSSVRAGRMFGVRFRPGVGPAVFGVPAHALRDQRVALAELWPDAERLAESLSVAPDAGELLCWAAAERLRELTIDPVVSALRVPFDVSGLADRIGVGERQLRRRCLDAFGYGPKVLQRVLRFDHATRLAWSGVPFAEIAHRAGYADQSHLSREVKEFAGVSLGQLIRS